MKIMSLLKAVMTENMSLFKIKSKAKYSKIVLPVILTLLIFWVIYSYAKMIIEPLVALNLEYVMLTIFVLVTTILTFFEGIYKSGNLLFDCKDDNLLFSLPIKKSTVLFVRIFKFYVFEVLYNSLFLLPAFVVYAIYVKVGILYYIVSILALLMLPIIPIVVSSMIGGIITKISSRFKLKNVVQILLAILFLRLYFYFYNTENLIANLTENAANINSAIIKIYYPAGLYIRMITDFKILDLIIFIVSHISIFGITILLLGKIYFKINSSAKAVIKSSKSKNVNYKIKSNKLINSLILKELKRFVSSPVFVMNAGMGLLLFVLGCIFATFKLDSIIGSLNSQTAEGAILASQVNQYIPLVLFGYLCFCCMTVSITSSMISLEGKSFSILKSLPVKPETIIKSKILTAVLIMMPFLLVGDLMIFIKYSFNIFEIMMILIASIIFPLVSETIGMIVNLKYPKMDAENDTEVVKQSMSSMVSVLFGMVLGALSIVGLMYLLSHNLSIDLIIFIVLLCYILLYCLLLLYIKKFAVKDFNKINV